MEPGLSTTLTDTDLATAKQKVTDALDEQGFGVLTEIDVQATMKKKLDEDMETFTILGACNPHIAHRALGVRPQIGMLLPCNVVIRADTADDTGRTLIVEAMNPDLMGSVTGEQALTPIAAEAGELLRRAIATIAAP
ncbi:DUF302 domain-containing protein [Williamsia herbipolensis]|uniref:DUF302 domain-containing protein n=1 Tax=Williamsia herbipolensis TaxID=1603258 RepID=A0AAU4JY89_9NOCA|nr:DUF302 domain-containing protein [Williamsia herbipolensis]